MRALSRNLIEKLRRLKLIASDLDGTLLDDKGEISDTTRRSVGRLNDVGILVAIMTARPHYSAERIADQLSMRTPIVSFEGDLIRLPHSSENLRAKFIKSDVVRRVTAEAEKSLSSVALFVDDRIVRLESDWMLPHYIEALGPEVTVVEDLLPFIARTIQLVIGSDSRRNIRSMARQASVPFSGVRTEIYSSAKQEERWYLEISGRHRSKATGLEWLEKFYRVGKGEVAVLGDSSNDIAAFRRAGTRVAMKNAVHELKERADIITESTNDDDGAAEFFDLVHEINSNNRN